MDEKVSARGAVGQGPDLTGRVVVVTGAGGGQRLAETRLLAAAGAVVLAADLAPEPSPDLRQVIAEHGSALAYVRLDVTAPGDWAVPARSAERELGRIDGLVNDAGTTRRPRLLEATPEDLAALASFVTGAEIPVDGGQSCHGGAKSISDALR